MGIEADGIAAEPEAPPARRREVIYRHAFLVRFTHWINALAIFIMVGSGLAIFNAHPHLYWGQKGSELDHPFLSITGARAWPAWITIPSFQDLANARHWHFLFAWILAANGLLYLAWGLFSGHLKRDIAPTLADLGTIPRSVIDHIKLKHPTGEAAKRYNVLQRLAYLGLIILVVLMVATGLTMSPGFDAFAPWLLDLFGGRQSARSIHFLCAAAIVAFVAVHLIEVVLAGPINEVRSMITGRYAVPPDHGP